MSLNADTITRTPCQARVALLCAYYDTHDEFDAHLWEEANNTLPDYLTTRLATSRFLIVPRREVRLACMMGGPL